MNPIFLFLFCLPVSAELPDGTLVLLRDSNPLVKKITQSSWTHIGIVFRENGNAWVYEASPGRVRRLPFSDFVLDSYLKHRIYFENY